MRNRYFRVYDEDMGREVTRLAKEKIEGIIEMVKNVKSDAIYSDTDSVFVVVTSLDKGQRLKKYLNKQIKPYELDIKNYFENILFTGTEQKGTKKRYAGYNIISGEREFVVVGLEIKRSNSFELLKRMQRKVIDLILNKKPKADVTHYTKVMKSRLIRGDFDKDLIITEGIKPNLIEYKVDRPNVRVAKKMLERGLDLGFSVSYVMTPVGEEPIIEGVIPKIVDRKWYISHRLDPMLKRLLSVYETGKQTKLEI